MKIFVAGAAGDLGSKVAARLSDRGDDVYALTRSAARSEELAATGLRPVLGDLLDAASTLDAVASVRPDVVIEAPIALPERGPVRARDLAATNRLRVVGTRNLVDAAVASGVRRYVSESIVAIYGFGKVGKVDETTAPATSAPIRGMQQALDAVLEHERLVADAAGRGSIETVVARMGLYYGKGVGSSDFMTKLLRRRAMVVSDQPGALPWVEVSDAATGLVAALDRGRPGGVYNIVGDESASFAELAREMARQFDTPPPRVLPKWIIKVTAPYAALMSGTLLYVSNRKAKDELAWTPMFPTIEEGVAHAASHLRERT